MRAWPCSVDRDPRVAATTRAAPAEPRARPWPLPVWSSTRVCIVLGNRAERLESEVAGLPVAVAVNHAWASGMASSVRTGLEAVLGAAADSDAVVFTLCDQPLVTAEVLDGLVHAWQTTGRSIVACAYGDGQGVPALFARPWFGELSRLTGDAGAKAILRTHASQVSLVPFPGGAVDVDSPADYARLASGTDGDRPSRAGSVGKQRAGRESKIKALRIEKSRFKSP